MRIGKLWLVTILAAIPAALPGAAHAQVSVGVGVNVNIDANAYDSTAPGDPVESVDVFYDQLSPNGVWVDDPDAGRVFIPQQDAYVPYTTGHWEYTRLGFVWVSSEPFGWATSHYGRWGYNNNYGRWVWAPDTSGDRRGLVAADRCRFRLGAARTRWASAPPAESWHYCGSAHILDANVNRYYEPRERVIAIHREARPIEHYQTVSNVKVVVGPPPSVLRDHRVEARPVQIEQKSIGRWSAPEAHAQVQRAQEHRATFEQENQHRVQANAHINTAQQKVIESHPQLKVQAEARIKAQPNAPQRTEPVRPGQPAQPMTPQRIEPNRGPKTEPTRPAPQHAEPNREPARAPQPTMPQQHMEPNREPARPAQPIQPKAAPQPAPHPVREAPHAAQPHAEPARPESAPRAQPIQPRAEPAQPRQEPARVEAPRAQPAPHAEPARAEPPHAAAPPAEAPAGHPAGGHPEKK